MISVRKRITVLVLVVLAAAGWLIWRRLHQKGAASDSVMLYGNVDIRQVEIAFNDSERIDQLLVEEGSTVHRGQLIGRLARQRYSDAVARDRSRVAAQQEIVARLRAGSRPEEIAAARADAAAAEAGVAAAQANLKNAEGLYHRQQTLASEQYVSLQIRDDAERAYRAREAELAAAEQTAAARQQALKIAVIGPRAEDIAAAEATLQAERASLALEEKQLADTELYAPSDGIIQNRIHEPGDMVTPQTPVYTLALDNPLWVRAWLPEKQLGRVRPGMRAWIEVDSFPGERFPGWVGFVSPVSEFTPKNVETTELRSQLVYRVRIYACNPGHRLRLGMPATVIVPLGSDAGQGIDAAPCREP